MNIIYRETIRMVLEYWFLTSGAEDKNIWAEMKSEL